VIRLIASVVDLNLRMVSLLLVGEKKCGWCACLVFACLCREKSAKMSSSKVALFSGWSSIQKTICGISPKGIDGVLHVPPPPPREVPVLLDGGFGEEK